MYVWAAPTYTGDLMYFSMAADTLFEPPSDRRYLLELLGIPEGMVGAPPVGTVWELPLGGTTFTLELPTYRTIDGLESYRFAFTITAVIPEPNSAALLLVGGATVLARRRW